MTDPDRPVEPRAEADRAIARRGPVGPFACHPSGVGGDGPRGLLIVGIDATEKVRAVREQEEPEARIGASRRRPLTGP